MPSDSIPQSTEELLAAVERFLTALNNPAGQVASGVPTSEFVGLAAAKTTLAASHAQKAAHEAAYRGSVAAERSDKDVLARKFRVLRRAATNAVGLTDELRAAAGLPPKTTVRGAASLPKIDDLIVLGRPSGANFIDWTGPTGGSLVYDVFTRTATETEWTLLKSITSTDYLHRDAGAGVHRLYRVVPRRGEREGDPSNEAVVYA